MKRLLLTQGRTGSLVLTRYIRESNNINVYREPFNTTSELETGLKYDLNKILSETDIFVENKIGTQSLPIELQNLSIDDLMCFFIKNFHIIGILIRKDIVAQTESALNAIQTGNWDSSYIYNEIDKTKVDEYKKMLEKEQSILKYISKSYNIPIFYYEDLYLINQKENLKNFCDHFNIKYVESIREKHMALNKKYRISKNKNLI